jgi:uncharacterized protein
MKVAIIGSGVSGLVAASRLQSQSAQGLQITLFEAGHYFGGHTHTVDVRLPDENAGDAFAVDTGFLVMNERTYPGVLGLLADLGVETALSDMSFSVQVGQAFGANALEWNGANLNTVFAQRRNLLRPAFWAMLSEVLRFNKLANALALDLPQQSHVVDQGAHDAAPKTLALMQPLGDFLAMHRFSQNFKQWYLLPMLGCIWSCPTEQMLNFPVLTMLRFCHNHGLIQVNDRPQWYTVKGGARHYVDKLVAGLADARLNTPVQRIERHAAGVTVVTAKGREPFDKVVLATHSDQALALLDTPSQQEQRCLSAIRYQANLAVLHTDASVMPKNHRAWAAWNYVGGGGAQDVASHAPQRVCLHYWLNRLQPLPTVKPVFVSLNPVVAMAPQCVLGQYDYAHPVFDTAAIQAQALLPALQGQQHTYYAGAWMGYGFHEDGFKAGVAAAQAVMRDAVEQGGPYRPAGGTAAHGHGH